MVLGHSRRHLVVVALALLVSSACTTARMAKEGRRGFKQAGIASWYGPGFHGKTTANGETYDMHALTAAHKYLPFDSLVEVQNRDNGKTVRVRINDRGPFVRGRIIDLSRRAAEQIDMIGPGTARVRIRIIEAAGKRGNRSTRVADARSGPLMVQIGAFRQGHLAEELHDRARAVRPDVKVRYDGSLFRVEVGPFAKKGKAADVQRELIRKGFEAVLLPGD